MDLYHFLIIAGIACVVILIVMFLFGNNDKHNILDSCNPLKKPKCGYNNTEDNWYNPVCKNGEWVCDIYGLNTTCYPRNFVWDGSFSTKNPSIPNFSKQCELLGDDCILFNAYSLGTGSYISGVKADNITSGFRLSPSSDTSTKNIFKRYEGLDMSSKIFDNTVNISSTKNSYENIDNILKCENLCNKQCSNSQYCDDYNNTGCTLGGFAYVYDTKDKKCDVFYTTWKATSSLFLNNVKHYSI